MAGWLFFPVTVQASGLKPRSALLWEGGAGWHPSGGWRGNYSEDGSNSAFYSFGWSFSGPFVRSVGSRRQRTGGDAGAVPKVGLP